MHEVQLGIAIHTKQQSFYAEVSDVDDLDGTGYLKRDVVLQFCGQANLFDDEMREAHSWRSNRIETSIPSELQRTVAFHLQLTTRKHISTLCFFQLPLNVLILIIHGGFPSCELRFCDTTRSILFSSLQIYKLLLSVCWNPTV